MYNKIRYSTTLYISIITVLLCFTNTTVFAYDFYQKYKGNTLYFNKLEGNTVELTYQNYSSDNYKKIKTLHIPTTINSDDVAYKIIGIGESAFSGAKNLKEVIFEQETEIEYIGEGAFAGCNMLYEFNIPINIKEIAPYTFAWSGIKHIKIKDSVNIIGERAFTNCKNLNSVSLGKQIEIIDNFAFAWCSQLKEFTIPEQIKKMGYDILQSCNNIDTIFYSAVNCKNAGSYYDTNEERMVGAFEHNNGLKAVKIDSHVEVLPAYIFYNCRAVNFYNDTLIGFPKSIKQIDEYAIHHTFWYDSIPDDIVYVNNIAYSYKGSTDSISYQLDDKTTAIAPFCFYGKNIKQITLPSSIEHIGKSAFEKSDIRNIKLPLSLKKIDERAFADCENLTTVQFNNNIDSIEEYAFSNCINLEKVELTNQTSYIGDAAFYRCKNISSAILPASLKTISPGIFSRCINLQKVELPTTAEQIGEYAFAGCIRLDNITIPHNCSTIGYKAFTHCYSLESVDFNNNEYEIGSLAFYRCESLTEVNIIAAKKIGYKSFGNCDNLMFIDFGKNLKEIGAYAFNNCIQLRMATIPSSIERIGRYAFANCRSIQNIKIEDANTTIETGAFTNCQSLLKIELGNNIQEIDKYAFSNCKSLTNIKLPQSINKIKSGTFSNCYQLKEIELNYNIEEIGEHAFAYCENLNIKNLPSSLHYIGKGAFKDCKAITTITMPTNLKTIEKQAFYNCIGLRDLTINKNLQKIGDDAFVGCRSINNINWNAIICTTSQTNKNVFDYTYTPIILNIGNNVELIDKKLFKNINLTSVSIPQSVTDIGYKAFADNTNLNDITIDASAYLSIDKTSFDNTPWESKKQEGIIYLDKIAFKYKGDDKPSNLIIKEGTTSIAANFMKGNKALKAVKLPQSLISIGKSAFEDCENLYDINFTDNITNIEEKAFSYCKNITNITLNNSIKTIGDYAFEKCENIDTINIQSSYITIGEGAFMSCSALKHAYLGNYVASLGEKSFAYCMQLSTINAIDKTELPQRLTTIESATFYNCESLKNNIILPESIERIEESAFYGCQSIYSMKLTPNLKHIAFSAFDNTNNFTRFIGYSAQFESVNGALISYKTGNLVFCPKGVTGTFVVKKSVKKIEKYAFYKCINVDHISGMQGIEIIEEKAFSGCSNMKSIRLGKDLKEIGSNIFEGCINLNNIILNKNNQSFKVIDGVLYSFDMKTLYFCPRTKTGTFIIPHSVRIIDDYAFAHCIQLDNIIKHNKITSIGKNAFLECRIK